MKKLNIILIGTLSLLSIGNLYAQTSKKATTKPATIEAAPGTTQADYFAGKWNVLVVGTPNGDAKMLVSLVRKDGKLTGNLVDSNTNTEIAPITEIEETEKSVKLYFTAQNYDVNLTLEKKDEDNVTGNMLDLFEAKGVRAK